MKQISGSYPHPVIGNADDVASVFKISNAIVNMSVDDVEVLFDMVLDDPDMSAALEAGAASLRATWSCPGTLSSDELVLTLLKSAFETRTYRGYIDQRRVRGKVQVDFKIISNVENSGYRLGNQHADYGDSTFHVLPGDILGEAGQITFDPLKAYDPLDPPVGSCFNISVNDKLGKGFQLGLDDDEVVTIYLSRSLFDGVRYLGADPNFLIVSLVLPALIQVVSIIRDVDRLGDASGYEAYSETAWFLSIRKLMESLPAKFSEAPPLEVAQRLLEYPTDRATADRLEGEEDD